MKNKVFGCFFAILLMFSGLFGINPVLTENAYAEPETEEITSETGLSCEDSLGSLGWLVCPSTGKVSEAVDFLYDQIEGVLEINPVEAKDGSPIYEIWKYFQGVTNIVFILFLLVIVFSQITGLGITNYGVKKALPKLIIAAVLVNLSFYICSLAVDVSNIFGEGIRDIFESIESSVSANIELDGVVANSGVAMSEMYQALGTGAALTIAGGAITFGLGAIWMLIPLAFGALVSVVVGLITIAMRQAVVTLLIMIAPLAMVAYILPNTEVWFKKWRQLLFQMLIFYPAFSLLFGASSVAGWAIIISAQNGFGVLMGIAVQVFPLFFSWSLMKMSGTFLGTINNKLQGLAAKPLAANRAWANSMAANTRANTLAHGVVPSAKLMQYLEKRRALREEDTKNALEISAGKSKQYVHRKIAASEIGDLTSKYRSRAPRYTRNAKEARNYSLISQNAAAHTEHVLNNYGRYFDKDRLDKQLNLQSQHAFVDYGRAAYLKEIDDENDTNWLIDKYLAATKRDENGNPADPVAFERYMTSVAGPNGEQRLAAKIITQASRVESKQRAEFSVLYAKYGHNGYNKRQFRDWIVGYKVDDDGWAVDANGKRLKLLDETGRPVIENGKEVNLEKVQGDAITKAPERLVLYDNVDENGLLYYDFKDQNGNVVARVRRGVDQENNNYDDAAFIKETLSNLDIPIADPINNVYTILSGVKPGTVVTPQGQNQIGLARYSTTIGRAMKDYKSNAAWAGAMFNSGIGNRQIKNASQHAIWVLDSIVKTLKPGAYNTQNPASVEYITTVLDPDNWEKIFTEDELVDAVNINNKLYGGEDWVLDDDGKVIDYIPVENPNYEQRMNLLKRKLLFPAMKKVLPAFDRLRTSNTADNQKPGTADAQYQFLKMVEEKWENNPEINFDPTLVDQDLQSEARAFRKRKHDKNGNLIYASQDDNTNEHSSLLNELEEVYDRSMIPEDLIHDVFAVLNTKNEYSRALERFEELCNENPGATMQEIHHWFSELDLLV